MTPYNSPVKAKDGTAAMAGRILLQPGLPDLLVAGEVAELLRVSIKTVYRYISNGNLPSINIGEGQGGVRVPKAALEELVNEESTLEGFAKQMLSENGIIGAGFPFDDQKYYGAMKKEISLMLNYLKARVREVRADYYFGTPVLIEEAKRYVANEFAALLEGRFDEATDGKVWKEAKSRTQTGKAKPSGTPAQPPGEMPTGTEQ